MPVTGLTREISITYNSYAVGGSTGRHVHGYHVEEVGPFRRAITFDVVIVGTSQSAAISAWQAMEAAYATPYKDLAVTLGGTSLVSLSQSGNTGLDAVPIVTLPGGPPDSGLSRRYRVRIEFGLPATWATTSGLRDSRVAISKTPAGRAEVRLSGTFTATSGGGDAKAVHDAAIDSWAASQMTWLGITSYELVRVDEVAVSVNRKTATFARTYRELIFSQAGASLDDTAIVDQRLVVTRGRRGSEFSPTSSAGSGSGTPPPGASAPGTTTDQYGPGAGGSTGDTGAAVTVTPLMDVGANYSAWIAKSVTTDLRAKWTAILPWVLDQIRTATGGSLGVLGITPSFNFDENRIDAVIVGVARDPEGGSIVQNIVSVSNRVQPGYEFVPAWDGDPESAFVFRGSQIVTRTETRAYRTLSGGGGGASAPVGSAVASNAAQAGGSWMTFGVPSFGAVFGVGSESPGNAAVAGNSGDTVYTSGASASGASANANAAGGGGAPPARSGWYVLDETTETRPVSIGLGADVVAMTEIRTTRVSRRVRAV